MKNSPSLENHSLRLNLRDDACCARTTILHGHTLFMLLFH